MDKVTLLGTEMSDSSALSKEVLCLNPRWDFSFQSRTAFAWMGQYPAAYTLPGEGEPDISHTWGVIFSFHGANTRWTAGGRTVAMLFRKPSFWHISAFGFSIDFLGKTELARVLMLDDNIACQARYYSALYDQWSDKKPQLARTYWMHTLLTKK